MTSKVSILENNFFSAFNFDHFEFLLLVFKKSYGYYM